MQLLLKLEIADLLLAPEMTEDCAALVSMMIVSHHRKFTLLYPAVYTTKSFIEEYEAGIISHRNLSLQQEIMRQSRTHTLFLHLRLHWMMTLNHYMIVLQVITHSMSIIVAVYYMVRISLKIIITSSRVLAGMWPCGILIMLKELFIAKSKGRLYAALHQLLSSHPTFTTLDVCVNYDRRILNYMYMLCFFV